MTGPFDHLRAALADRYRIEREIGRGGMATVYLAEDLKHHRRVAVKVLQPEVAAVIGSGRFLREIEIAARLAHPRILPLYDSGSAEGRLYYVMPFVEGESLRQRLAREGPLPVADALRIAREVASALEHAHTRGVVHRDIKPENILLAGEEAVVADFGIARAVTLAGGERLTTSGMVLGTPAFMSPEQVLGSPAVDGRADLYSLGCVLYEMARRAGARRTSRHASSGEAAPRLPPRPAAPATHPPLRADGPTHRGAAALGDPRAHSDPTRCAYADVDGRGSRGARSSRVLAQPHGPGHDRPHKLVAT